MFSLCRHLKYTKIMYVIAQPFIPSSIFLVSLPPFFSDLLDIIIIHFLFLLINQTNDSVHRWVFFQFSTSILNFLPSPHSAQCPWPCAPDLPSTGAAFRPLSQWRPLVRKRGRLCRSFLTRERAACLCKRDMLRAWYARLPVCVHMYVRTCICHTWHVLKILYLVHCGLNKWLPFLHR